MTKNIEIKLFRVSSDSKYLDAIFNCPDEYYFNSFQLVVTFVNGSTLIFDLSLALFIVNTSDEDVLGEVHITSTVKKKEWTIRIPLQKLGIGEPAIYKAILKVAPVYAKNATKSGVDYYIPAPYSNIEGYTTDKAATETFYHVYNNDHVAIKENGEYVLAKTESEVTLTDIESGVMICSDVNFAYKCMLDELLKLGDCCETISDDVIRSYLILYGHLAAMFDGELEIAEKFFKMINKCFSSCGSREPNRHTDNKSCNCNRK